MKILFADDHFLVLDGLKDLIEKRIEGATVLLAADKNELFDKLEHHQPDLLIQDLKFGENNATDFLNTIIKKYPSLKLLILSSISDSTTIERMVKKTNGYIIKTEPTDIILEGIRSVINNEDFISPKAQKKLSEVLLDPTDIPLTSRELDIIREIMKEIPIKTIAKNLRISDKTVEMHRSNIYIKLNVSNITGLVKKVIALGIIET